MVTNITGWGDAGLLVNEQTISGDPAAGTGGIPVEKWHPGWTDWYYPASAIIDLKAEYEISSIYFYDANGTGNISVYGGNPSGWEFLFTETLNHYLRWNEHPVTITARYIKVTVEEKAEVPVEIVIYGTKVGEEVVEPVPVVHPRPLMKDFAGINGFIDDAVELSQVCNFIREYHNWSWNEDVQNEIKFAPSYPGWNFDTYYKTLLDSGITVAPCLKQSAPWLTSHKDYKPIAAGLNTEDPASYKEKASYMYQYAARYGSKVVDQSLLKLASNQQKLSGLNCLRYYEDWNEQDAWWHGRDGYFTPFEYAAMASANYDGHFGQIGNAYGIKNADPTSKFVMGGLAKMSLDYLKSIRLWAEVHRNGSFPADVINLHHYSNDNGGQGSSTTGISPEADSLKQRFKAFVDYRDQYLPGKEIWVTEFGYDVHAESVQRAPAIGTFSAEEVQAMWLIRSYLALAAAGMDRAAMYMSRDADAISSIKYSTSGLTEGGTKRKRESWYSLKTFNNVLGKMYFEREVETGNPNVLNYKFTEPGTGNSVFVLWCPTSNQTTFDYTFDLPDELYVKSLIIQKNLDPDGDTTFAYDKQKAIILSVSERPLYVLASNEAITSNVKAEAKSLSVYPTVTDDFLFLENSEPVRLEAFLTDIKGTTIASYILPKGISKIDVSGMLPGVYLLHAEGFTSKRIVIK